MDLASFYLDASAVERMAAQYPDVFAEEARTVLRIVTARLESEVVRRTPRGVSGSAGLAGSIFGEVVDLGRKVEAVVATPSPYGQVVELGRRPGKMPPVGPLALWAERKLGVAPDEAAGVAFLIARKIAARGTEGAFMFREAWRATERWTMNMIESIPARVARRVTEGS